MKVIGRLAVWTRVGVSWKDDLPGAILHLEDKGVAKISNERLRQN